MSKHGWARSLCSLETEHLLLWPHARCFSNIQSRKQKQKETNQTNKNSRKFLPVFLSSPALSIQTCPCPFLCHYFYSVVGQCIQGHAPHPSLLRCCTSLSQLLPEVSQACWASRCCPRRGCLSQQRTVSPWMALPPTASLPMAFLQHSARAGPRGRVRDPARSDQ